MAGRKFTSQYEGSTVSDLQVALVLVAPANTPLLFREYSVDFKGTNPVQNKPTVYLVRSSGSIPSPVAVAEVAPHNNWVDFGDIATAAYADISGSDLLSDDDYLDVASPHPQLGHRWRPPGGIHVKPGEQIAIFIDGQGPGAGLAWAAKMVAEE